jgi:RNA polymerase sigma-70 factor (ECF subfamily)
MTSQPRRTPDQERTPTISAASIEAGDAATIAEWHRREHARMMRVALPIIRDRRQALEVVQSAFIRALERVATLRTDALLGHWLARITRSVALNELRRQRRSFARSAPLEDAQSATSPDQVDPFVRDRVRAAVDALPETLRLPLLLSDVEGYTHVEIAERLGISAAASRTRASRARSILRVELASLAQPDELP